MTTLTQETLATTMKLQKQPLNQPVGRNGQLSAQVNAAQAKSHSSLLDSVSKEQKGKLFAAKKPTQMSQTKKTLQSGASHAQLLQTTSRKKQLESVNAQEGLATNWVQSMLDPSQMSKTQVGGSLAHQQNQHKMQRSHLLSSGSSRYLPTEPNDSSKIESSQHVRDAYSIKSSKQ